MPFVHQRYDDLSPVGGPTEGALMRAAAGRSPSSPAAAAASAAPWASASRREGMKVVLADVEAGALDETVAELRADGLDVIGVVTDVADLASVEALRDAALAAYGAVHVLCNNAGVGAGAEGRMWEHDANDWQWAFAVNVWGVIHGIKAFVPRMIAAGEPGHVVNTSSGDGGIAPLPSTPQCTPSPRRPW